MNVLFVGDIVGAESCAWLASRLPELRQLHDIDLTIVNAENIRIENGPTSIISGMTADGVQQLFDAGVDVITSGNHAWDGPDAEALLVEVRDGRMLSDGRLAVVVVIAQPVTDPSLREPGPTRSSIEVFAQIDGTWLIDDRVLNTGAL